MAPVNGRPFLEHQMQYWIAQGINHFVLSVGYRHQIIIDYFGTQFEGVSLEYVIEETPLGTGGGLMLAAQRISNQDYFLLLNGDTYFTLDLKALIEFFKVKNADWCFSLFRTYEKDRYLGLNVSPDGEISTLKFNTNTINRLVNGGVYLVSPSALSNIPFKLGENISLENDIFKAAKILGQRFFGKEFQDTFIDIGVPDDYHLASAILTGKGAKIERN
jgi:D-glycero-alpha-D-manno-heptose 1-phosphate guanylyltransferase